MSSNIRLELEPVQSRLQIASRAVERNEKKLRYNPVTQHDEPIPSGETIAHGEVIGAELNKREAEQQLKRLLSRIGFWQRARMFAVLGEFGFPFVYGVVALCLMLATQDFPMLWELRLKAH